MALFQSKNLGLRYFCFMSGRLRAVFIPLLNASKKGSEPLGAVKDGQQTPVALRFPGTNVKPGRVEE